MPRGDAAYYRALERTIEQTLLHIVTTLSHLNRETNRNGRLSSYDSEEYSILLASCNQIRDSLDLPSLHTEEAYWTNILMNCVEKLMEELAAVFDKFHQVTDPAPEVDR